MPKFFLQPRLWGKRIMQKSNIIMVGFMGSGKSTLGRRLAMEFNMNFDDMDTIIEHQEKKPVSEIFREEGEAYFRQLEEKIALQLSTRQHSVIATGGGTITNSHAMAVLSLTGTICYLQASTKRILTNVGDGSRRPLLQCGPRERLNRVRKLMAERIPLYEYWADFTVDVSSGNIKRSLSKMKGELERRMKKICIIHGPNINFTGIREQSVYGVQDIETLNQLLEEECAKLGFTVTIFQSNGEGAIVDKLQQCYHDGIHGIVINPGAYTHYSFAIRDAIASIGIPTVEVHLSNVYQRDSFRQTSVTAPACIGQICGFGFQSYVLGLSALQKY